MEAKIFNINGKEEGTYNLPEAIFGKKADKHFLHEVITAYLSNQRAGTANAKTRAEVSGGGKKPWKQKGTGRARHGSTRSPIWTKGGVAFGPKPRDFGVSLPKSKRKSALFQALSTKVQEENFVVLNEIKFKDHKTKNMAKVLETFKAGRKPLVVSSLEDKKIYLAGKNIAGLNYIYPSDINAYILLNSSKILITKEALNKFIGMHTSKDVKKEAK